MRYPRGFNLAAVNVVLILAGSGVAQGACNAIPAGYVTYRSAVGSIDRPFVSPDPDEVLTLRPACGSPSLQAKLDGNGDGARDLLVTLVFKPPRGPAEPFFIAGDGNCEGLEEPVCCLERLFCPPARRCIPGGEVGLDVRPDDGTGSIRFRFPDTGFAGPVTIAVTRSGKPAPLALEYQSCSDLQRSDLLACIDDLVATEPGDCDTPRVARAAMSMQASARLIALPASNDYRDVCNRDLGDLPRCKGNVDRVRYTVDAAGNVVMPFNWANILRPKAVGPDLDRRGVRASTAVEAFAQSAQHISIPSAVFLETRSQQGGTFTPPPIFIPEELPARPNELTLRGNADKPKSVLRFLRRRLWQHVCDTGVNANQACEPEPVDQPGIVDCPDATCIEELPPRYFACVGGSRAGLPCTRPLHCPDGQCHAGSTCYEILGDSTGAACMTDADCGFGQECGRGLFEFRDRVSVQGQGTVTRSAGFGDNGVCASGADDGDACSGPLSCSVGFVSCVRYRAEAITYQ